MRTTHREFILDLLSGVCEADSIPESLATDEQAVDWLFYLLHEVDYPASGLIEFLGKHCSCDRRFKLWMNRAFRPCLGEDGMESLKAFRYIEKWNPNHPLLEDFMRQAAYSFAYDTDFIFLGSDFQSHLRSRYSELIGDFRTGGDIPRQIAEMESHVLEHLAADTAASLKERLTALEELAQRECFDCFFRIDLPYVAKVAFLNRARDHSTPAMLFAARSALTDKRCVSLAFEILLSADISESDFVDLLELARKLHRQSQSLFLKKIMQPGCMYRMETIRNTAMDITREDKYSRYDSIPFLLERFPGDAEIIALIKSCAESESNDYRFSQILTELLDHGIEHEWVYSSALEFSGAHDDCDSTIRVFGRIGDINSPDLLLKAFESPIPSEQQAAIHSAGRYLYGNSSIREALIAQANAGNIEACKWIIRHYPDDPRTEEILRAHLESSDSWPYSQLIPLMCVQGIMLPQFREWLMCRIRDSSSSHGSNCSALLAIRMERDLLRDGIFLHWENLIFHHHRCSNLFFMWYSEEPLVETIIERMRNGDFLKHPRELLLQISDYADLAEALMDGIIAAASHVELTDAILMLGLLYGHRPETVRFVKDYVNRDPTQRKYGSEVAFAEALRLSKRDEKDFEWAVAAMEASSQLNNSGLAKHGPRLLAHFFGLTTEVRSALEIFSQSDTNPNLADSSRALLREKFPGYLPELTFEAVSLMPADRRIKHLRQLAQAKPPQIVELQHFALNDSAADVRKDALLQFRNLISWRLVPEECEIAGFVLKCLKDVELAGIAAEILAKDCPQDEQVANELLSAHVKFPDTGIIVTLAESFSKVPAVRAAVYVFIESSRNATPSPNPKRGCNCKICIGFDKKLYGEVMVLLHSPPFREDDEAKFFRKDILMDPWIESNWQTQKILNAEAEVFEKSERSAFLEQIARSGVLLPFRNAACECLAKMAETEDEALERLLAMMREDDLELKTLVVKSCKSIAVNSRKNHRILQALLKSVKQILP